MKSPTNLVILMDNTLYEIELLETDNPEYIKQMKQHINSMAILTLLQFKSPPKAKARAVQLMERSSK